MLHSVELDPGMAASARASYAGRWSHLSPHVCLYEGASLEVLGRLVGDLRDPIDFVFLDGGDGGDGSLTQQEFALLAPHVRPGGVVASHDWYNGKYIPQLEEEAARGLWSLSIIGNGREGDFERGSVGFATAVKGG